MELRQINFKGYQGKIIGVIEAPLKPPRLEIDTNEILFTEQFILSAYEELSLAKIRNYFEVVYQKWGKFGDMGDVIAVKVLKAPGNFVCYLSFIGRLAYNKPGLATDLFTVIKTKDTYYFVGIKRKNNPGQGKLAFPGGFIDVKGFNLETPIETVIREAEEEIGLKIKIIDRQVDLKNYSTSNVSVAVFDHLGRLIKGKLNHLGTHPTSDSEKIITTGLKRVYNTTVFALSLDASQIDLSEEDINNWLKAGDDASDLVVVNLNNHQKLEFGLEHHQLICDNYLAMIMYSLRQPQSYGRM